MKPKTFITAALALFVTASVAYLAVKETRGKPEQNAAQAETAPSRTGQEDNTAAAVSPEKTTADAKVVAYYFHGNVRCTTCRTIESYAEEAVQSGFADALEDGRLEWRVVNIEAPGNEHYVQAFQLSTRSVVLERVAGGKRQEWKNLQRVWELVRGDKEIFLKHIQDETRGYLEAVGK